MLFSQEFGSYGVNNIGFPQFTLLKLNYDIQ